MTNALPTSSDASLLKFFELQRSPFDRLEDTSELYLTEQHSFLSAHLADAMEEQDMLVVVCGQPGSGKSSLLARYSTTVYDSICLASIDDTCSSIDQFYAKILGQFGFGEISGTVEQLKHICMEFLKQQGKAGDPVVLLVDNAHQLRPEIFEQLRWMAGVRHETSLIVNLVLAGHPDLAKIMESPAMSQINAKRHVRFNIRSYTEDETANYIWHRLELAGDRQCVQFSDEAHSLIYRYSGGTPGLINLICNEALREVFQEEKKSITGEVIRRVVESHNLIPHVVPVHNKARRKTDTGYVDEALVVEPETKQDGASTAPAADDAMEFTGSAKTTADREAASEKPSQKGKAHAPKGARKRSAASALSIVEKVASLSEQLGDLRARKKDLELELFQRDSTIASLEDRLESEKLMHSKAKEKLDSGDTESAALQKKLNKARTKLNAQTTKLSAVSRDNKDLRSKLAAAVSDSSGLTQELSSSKSRIEVLQERAELSSSLQSALNDREQRLKDLQDTIQQNEKKIKEDRVRVEDQAGRIEALQNDLVQSNKSVAEAEALRKTIHEQEQQIAALREIVESGDESASEESSAELKLNINGLEAELETARNTCRELESEEVKAAEREAQLSAELSELREKLVAENKDHEAARSASNALETKLAKSEGIIHELQSQLSARDEHSDWLKTELNRLQNADENLAKAEVENQASRKRLLRLDSDMQSANDEIAELQSNLKSAEVTRQKLIEAEQTIGSLGQDMAAAEALTAGLEKDKNDLTKHVEKREEVISGLEQQAIELQNKNESLEGMLGDVTTKLSDNELQIGQIRSEREQLKAENDALQKELEALREEIGQTRPYRENFERQKEANAELLQTLDERTDEIAELTERLAEQAAAQSNAAAALANLDEVRPEVEELREQIDAIESQLSSEDSHAKTVDENLNANNAQLGEIEAELADVLTLQKTLQDSFESAGDNGIELAQAEQEIADLKKRLAEVSAAASAAAETDEVSNLHDQLADKDEQQSALLQELDESRSQLNELQKEFAREAQDNHELQRQLLALAEVEEELREELLHRNDLFDDLSAIENERNQLREELERLRRIHESSGKKAVPAPSAEILPTQVSAFQLELRHGDESIGVNELVREGAKLIVGRGAQSDIVVDSEFVSRNHLLISVYRGRLFVKDLHSTNGTYINGKRVSHCELHDGSVIAIGEHTIALKTVPR